MQFLKHLTRQAITHKFHLSSLKVPMSSSVFTVAAQIEESAAVLVTSASEATSTGSTAAASAPTGAEKSVSVSTDATSVKRDFKIAIFWHPACYEHNVPDHPEQPDRVSEILSALRTEFPEDCFRLAPIATEEQLLLFHQKSHLVNFMLRADKAQKSKEAGKTSYYEYDGDTTVMWATRAAAFHAAGAVVASVDAIFAPADSPTKAHTAFAAVRPPGHHAERNTVMGFCFFNNAAIGAKYAQFKYGKSHGVARVAVLDFDVHHGNGTEEGFRNDATLFYGSTHEKDNFPGTGPDMYPNIGDNAKNELHRRIVNRYLDGGGHKKSREQFFSRWLHVVDEMERFKPDLIIISAGFDAHGDDPIGNCWLEDADFGWATDMISRAAARIRPKERRPVPIISVLEGGYDLQAISRSAVVHCQALQKGYVEPAHVPGDEAAALAESIEKMGI